MKFHLSGLTNFYNDIFFILNSDTSKLSNIHNQIQKIYKQIFSDLKSKNISYDQMTETTQLNLKFLEYINERNNFDLLASKIKYIQETVKQKVINQNTSVFVKVFPSKYNWKLKYSKTIITIELNIPFVIAENSIIENIIDKILKRDKKISDDAVSQFMISNSYKEFAQKFLLSHTNHNKIFEDGYDLNELFDTINCKYFNNEIKKPTLKWNKRLTYSKFGEFNPLKYQITLSAVLSHKDIPKFVVEYVMYHEMLHIKYPMKSSNKGLHIHHSEFKEMEKKFTDYEKAERYLKNLSLILRKKI
ncbi:MAG TPA: hypothetical protein PLI27_10680 [Ignavibacteriales bacterium]|nr:hypothetical protein [Ignavibacteriales bacterium]HOL81738.1 hypothetical protein [Ignavibacteriales bacterium]HOM65703.1 hypothetical protein [Ignavibacteriales bacterium]HPD68525.1 hypothetical protein [Ignavibacteriales bacterium]HPP32924.1 hypothetical protein [Ignavibacteriales bacterium]